MGVKMDLFSGKEGAHLAETVHQMSLHGDSAREFSVLVDALIAKYRESYGGARLQAAETVFPQCFPADRTAAAGVLSRQEPLAPPDLIQKLIDVAEMLCVRDATDAAALRSKAR